MICSEGTKRFWKHCWSKWAQDEYTLRVRRTRDQHLVSEVLFERRRCDRCGTTQMKKIISTGEVW